MRKKELKLVVTFHTTADAMAMEKACQNFMFRADLSLFREKSRRDAALPGARLSKLRSGWRVL